MHGYDELKKRRMVEQLKPNLLESTHMNCTKSNKFNITITKKVNKNKRKMVQATHARLSTNQAANVDSSSIRKSPQFLKNTLHNEN
jgi:hypothetical protein